MIDVISTENFDVVHSSIYPTDTARIAFRSTQESKIPLVFTPYFHYLKNEFRDSICLREMLKKSSVVVACSNMEREKLIEMGSDPSRTFVIPLSINSEILPNDWFDKSFNRSMLGITGEFVIVTYPWTGKGGDLVLRTAMTVSQDIKGISVVTIGEPDRVYSAIREKANRTAPNLQILDMGWLTGEQKWRAISSGDVFALPSSSDAFGMSYLDAWTASIPIVVLKGTPQEEMVRDKIDGFAIRHDAKELENVLRMLLMDMGMCQQAGNEGRRRVREEFSPAKMVSRYVDVYHLAMR
jgi:glycosyltransferase involved in cell wall biosynthesis